MLSSRRLGALAALGLVVAVLAAYAPVLDAGFVAFDDDVYVTDNPHVAGGLTADGARRAFSTVRSGNWHPLTWLSHMLDVELFGATAPGHHLVSVLIHAANAILLLLLLAGVTGTCRAAPSSPPCSPCTRCTSSPWRGCPSGRTC